MGTNLLPLAIFMGACYKLNSPMIRISFFGLFALFCLAGLACKNTTQSGKVLPSTQFVRTQGSILIDPHGDELLLKGTNLGHWLVPEGYMFKTGQVNSPRKIDELFHEMIGPDSLSVFWGKFLDHYITREDIAYLKDIGCNHLRLPFHYKLFTDELYLGKRRAGFQYMDKVVDWCKQEEIYLLLDMHCAPGGQTGDNIDDSFGYPFLFKSQASQDLMTRIWVDIATRYRDEPIVLGYDLMNEPVAHYFIDEIDDFNPVLFQLYQRLISEIRLVDPNHTIFVNGSVWSGNFDVFSEMLGENIVYEFHKYWFDVKLEAIQPYLDFREANHVPVYIGETGENTDEWIASFRQLLDQHRIGWAFWPYKKMNNTRGIMNFNEPGAYYLISQYANSDRSSYKAIRENRPEVKKVQQALNEFILYCRYDQCFPNPGYVEALGFKK